MPAARAGTWRRVIGLGVAAAVLAGCQSIGAPTVERDRLDYAGAMAESWKQQTLLNIVKFRYLDTPVFLDVASVISSYELAGQVTFGATVFPNAAPNTNQSIGATGTYTDRPTISYTPLTGERFINSLLRPIPPQTIFAMIEAGHPADFILEVTVRAINGVYNRSAAPARARRGEPAFYRVAEALRRIQQAGAIGLRTMDEKAALFFRRNISEDVDRDIAFIKQTLGLAAERDEFPLGFGSLHASPNEIALLTRSMQEILVELSAGVDVPATDIAEGRATAFVRASADADPHERPLVSIKAGRERPADAYAAARYRGLWFWIDDRDLNSKRTFMLLMMFSSLAETGAVPQTPIITIPAH